MSVVISSRYQLEVSTLHWHDVCDSNQGEQHTHTYTNILSKHTQPAGGAAVGQSHHKRLRETHTHTHHECVF